MDEKKLNAYEKKKLYNTNYSRNKYKTNNLFKSKEMLRSIRKKTYDDNVLNDLIDNADSDINNLKQNVYNIKLYIFNKKNYFLLKEEE
tara:strand:+ start:1558 stop:1821 length:264 start_codon:yes stop_codon:yes gene_type:complete